MQLSNKLQQTFSSLKSKTTISQENITDAIKAVKVSLLEADVNLDIVNKITVNLTEKAAGVEVEKGLSASEAFIKIVHDEILEILGKNQISLKTDIPYHKIMFVGLQGSGKTTSIAKVTKFLKEKHKKKVLVVAADIYRPAAIEQIKKLGADNNFEVFEKGRQDPLQTVKEANKYAQENKFDTLIIDTAGRLHIDNELMDELGEIKKEINPQDILIAIDALSGQEILNVAKGFNDALDLTGAILTKADGDAKGGATLSVKYSIGTPIVFVGTGEKVEALETFDPKKWVKKILGMKDVVTFVEEVKEIIDEKSATKVGNKIMSGKFNFKDMLFQMKSVQKLGLGKLAGLIPGIPKITEEQKAQLDSQIKVIQAIVDSMTEKERKNPKLIIRDKTRKARIIKGSGRNAQEYNKLLTQYDQMIKMAKLMKNQKGGFGNKFPRL